MSVLGIHPGEWVVVCDGTKALVLENAGEAKFLNLKTREVFQQDDPKTHEQGTDAPGRSINSVDASRSAMEQTDWHQQAEERFLQKLAGVTTPWRDKLSTDIVTRARQEMKKKGVDF